MNSKFLFPALMLAAACGGGGNDRADADLEHSIDARRPPDAPGPIGCAVEDTFNTVGPIADPKDPAQDSAVFETDVGDPPVHSLFWQWLVPGTSANPDWMFFDVPFPVAAADLEGPLELVAACTASVDYCMRIITDSTDQGFAQLLYPDTGTITITAAEGIGGQFSVEVTDALFNHYDPMTGMPIADGCATNMTGFTFDAIVIEDGGKTRLRAVPPSKIHDRVAH